MCGYFKYLAAHEVLQYVHTQYVHTGMPLDLALGRESESVLHGSHDWVALLTRATQSGAAIASQGTSAEGEGAPSNFAWLISPDGLEHNGRAAYRTVCVTRATVKHVMIRIRCPTQPAAHYYKLPV